MEAGDLPGKDRLGAVAIGRIPPGEGKEVVCFLRGHRTPGDRIAKIKVRYHEVLGGGQSGEECAVERDEKLSFGKPFQVGANVTRQQIVSSQQALHLGEADFSALGREELFSLSVSVKPSCEAPIIVSDVTLFPVTAEQGGEMTESLDQNSCSVQLVSESQDQDPKPWNWKTEEIHKFHFLLKVHTKTPLASSSGPLLSQASTSNAILPVGYLQITWKREDSDLPSDGFVAVTKVPIVSADESKRNLTLITDLPSFGHVGEVIPVSYTIGNASNQVLEVTSSLESSEAFMFSGFRACTFRLLPFSSHKLTFNCYPTQSGRLTLPLLHLHDKRQEAPQPIGPISIFVKPGRQLH